MQSMTAYKIKELHIQQGYETVSGIKSKALFIPLVTNHN